MLKMKMPIQYSFVDLKKMESELEDRKQFKRNNRKKMDCTIFFDDHKT